MARRATTCSRKPGAVVTLAAMAALVICGCSSVRPVANDGHKVLENPGYPMWVRVPAGLGATAGYIAALPFGAIFYPTYPFESQAVTTSQGYCQDPQQGDIWIPLAGAPYDYGSGVGAAVFGWPFERLSIAMSGAPGRPPGALEETPEPRPGEPDPELDFTVRPPAMATDALELLPPEEGSPADSRS